MGLRPVHIDCRDFTDGSQTHLTVTNRAVTTEPSPSAIGGQSTMAVTIASPETSSSGRLNGSIRPAQMPLRRIHERGRIISASTMPPSLRSTVIDNLAQVLPRSTLVRNLLINGQLANALESKACDFQDRIDCSFWACRVTENLLNSLAVRDRPGPVDKSRIGLSKLRS